jgi:hypothetical protein
MSGLRQVAAVLVCAFARVSGAAPALAFDTSECTKTFGAIDGMRVADLSRLVDPQFPDESGVFPNGLFFELMKSDGAPYTPSTMDESNCYLDAVLGKEVVSAMVKGAKRAVDGTHAGSSALKQIEKVFKSVDDEISRTIPVSQTTRLSLLDIRIFIEDRYRLQMPIRVAPSPMQAAIYGDDIYQEWTSVDYVLVRFLAHRGVKLNIDSIREAFQDRDKSVAPPTIISSRDCDAGIDYEWPTISGAPSSAGGKMPMDGSVHWGRCRSTNTIYAYVRGRGWRKATAKEREEVCNSFGHVSAIRPACVAK